MELFIVTPKIKCLSETAQRRLADSKLVLMTNPLHQEPLRRYGSAGTSFLVDDDFISAKQFEIMVETAKHLGWDWFRQKGFENECAYSNIDLRCLFTQDLVHYLVQALKIFDLYSGIFEKYDIDRITVFDDGSEWGTFAERMAQLRKIPFERLRLKTPPSLSKKDFFVKTAKIFLNFLNRLRTPFVKSGDVLYSASLRFVLPFLERGERSYYLRDTFSAEAWRISKKYHFTHILPGDFKSGRNSEAIEQQCRSMVSEIEAFLNTRAFFIFKQINLWPIIRDDFIPLAQKRFFEGAQLIDRFLDMFRKLGPRAVLVDEEVCFFNKTLIQVANSLGIPTFCLEHGAPVESVGSIPSTATQLLVWGRTSKERLCGWGIPESKIQMTGAPQFKSSGEMNRESHRSFIAKCLKIKPDMKYLLLTAFPVVTNEDPTFTRASLGIKIQNAILSIVTDVLEKHADMHLIVKFHPADREMDFTAQIIKKTALSVQRRIRLVRQFDTQVLIAGAYAVLTTGSTTYFEALLQEKPVFLLDYKNNRIGEFLSDDFLDLEHLSECVSLLNHRLDPSHINENTLSQKKEIARHFYKENKEAVERIREILSNPTGGPA